jgi:hypothetical protein
MTGSNFYLAKTRIYLRLDGPFVLLVVVFVEADLDVSGGVDALLARVVARMFVLPCGRQPSFLNPTIRKVSERGRIIIGEQERNPYNSLNNNAPIKPIEHVKSNGLENRNTCNCLHKGKTFWGWCMHKHWTH